MHRNLTKFLLTATCTLLTSIAMAATELSDTSDISLHQVSHNIRANLQIGSFLTTLTAPSVGKLRQLPGADPVTPAALFIGPSEEATVPEAARAGVVWIAPIDPVYFRYPLAANPAAKFAAEEWSIRQKLNSCMIGTIIEPTDTDYFGKDNIAPTWVMASTTNDQFNTLLTSIFNAATKPGATFKQATLPVLAGGFAIRATLYDALLTNKRYAVTCHFADKT